MAKNTFITPKQLAKDVLRIAEKNTKNLTPKQKKEFCEMLSASFMWS